MESKFSLKETALHSQGLSQPTVKLSSLNVMLENEKGVKLNEVTDLMGNPVEEFKDLPDTEEFYVSEQEDCIDIEWNGLSFEKARGVLSGAQGKILTIIDATYPEDSRKKYVKDLVRNAFSQQGDWLFELAIGDFEENK